MNKRRRYLAKRRRTVTRAMWLIKVSPRAWNRFVNEALARRDALLERRLAR